MDGLPIYTFIPGGNQALADAYQRGESAGTLVGSAAVLAPLALSEAAAYLSAYYPTVFGGLADWATAETTGGVLIGAGTAAAASRAVPGGIRITEEGLDIATRHLAQFGEHAPNQAMLDRLGSAVGSRVTGADANFYLHEISEATMMGRGMSYEAAHAAAIEKYGVSPFSLYHPEVIQRFPAEFNNAWRAFWGIQ
jgi:hypothetical protein